MSDGFPLKLRFHRRRHKDAIAAIHAVKSLQFRRATMINWATKALRSNLQDSTHVPQHVPAEEGVTVKLNLTSQDSAELIRHLLTLPMAFRCPVAVELVVEGFQSMNLVHADPHGKPPSSPPFQLPPPTATDRDNRPDNPPAAAQPARAQDQHDLDVVADFEKGTRPMMSLLADWNDD